MNKLTGLRLSDCGQKQTGFLHLTPPTTSNAMKRI